MSSVTPSLSLTSFTPDSMACTRARVSSLPRLCQVMYNWWHLTLTGILSKINLLIICLLYRLSKTRQARQQLTKSCSSRINIRQAKSIFIIKPSENKEHSKSVKDSNCSYSDSRIQYQRRSPRPQYMVLFIILFLHNGWYHETWAFTTWSVW